MSSGGKCPGSGQPGKVISRNRLYCQYCGRGFNQQAVRQLGKDAGKANRLPSHHTKASR